MFTVTQISNGKAVTPDSPGDMLCTFCAIRGRRTNEKRAP